LHYSIFNEHFSETPKPSSLEKLLRNIRPPRRRVKPINALYCSHLRNDFSEEKYFLYQAYSAVVLLSITLVIPSLLIKLTPTPADLAMKAGRSKCPFHFCVDKNGIQKTTGNTKHYCPQYQQLAAPKQLPLVGLFLCLWDTKKTELRLYSASC